MLYKYFLNTHFNPKITIIIHCENATSVPLESQSYECPLSLLLYNIFPEVLNKAIRQEYKSSPERWKRQNNHNL